METEIKTAETEATETPTVEARTLDTAAPPVASESETAAPDARTEDEIELEEMEKEAAAAGPRSAAAELLERVKNSGPRVQPRVLADGKTYFFQRLAFAEVYSVVIKSQGAGSFEDVLNRRFAALLNVGIVKSETDQEPLCDLEEWRAFVAQPDAMELSRELVEAVAEVNPKVIEMAWGSLAGSLADGVTT